MHFSMAIFDLDGTLVDSLPDIASALNQTLAEEDDGAPPLPLATVAAYVGDGAAKLVQRALGAASPQRLAERLDRFQHHYARCLHDETRPYPGMEDVLRRLSPAMPLAVLTNKPAGLARSLLAALALDRYFADVVGDGDGFARKPSPDAGRWLLERHGATAAQTLVVGDGLADVRFAHALSAPAAAVSWGYVSRDLLAAERPTWLVDAPEQLLDIVLP